MAGSDLILLITNFNQKTDMASAIKDFYAAFQIDPSTGKVDSANIAKVVADFAKIFNNFADLAREAEMLNPAFGQLFGNNYAKFSGLAVSLYQLSSEISSPNSQVHVGPVADIVSTGLDLMGEYTLRSGAVPLGAIFKTGAWGVSTLGLRYGDMTFHDVLYPTIHVPTIQENMAQGKSPSGGVYGQITDGGGKYAIFATKDWDGTITELVIPMQGSTITNNRVASGTPTKYVYSSNGQTTRIEHAGNVLSVNPQTGNAIGSVKVYNDASYGLLTDILATTDFLSSSIGSESNVFSPSSTKGKLGTISGIRKAAGALSAGEKWGGQTFATAASSNLGSYLSSINFVDPSSAYQNAVVNSFNFNTNFGGYIPPSAINVQVIFGWPIVLDLNQNGIELISLDESRALFDMSGTGFRQRTAWVAPTDALLAIDYDNDGVIKERKEINFVDWTSNSTLTDMEALALAFDTNNNGKLDSGDADFLKFRVWQDKNADGISDVGELQTLTQAGITSIDLKTTKMDWDSGASSISALGTYTKSDGSQRLLADAAFGHESAGWKASVVNGIQRVTNENGDVYGIANPTGNFVVNLNTEGLTGAIGGSGDDSMTMVGATAVFMQGNAGDDSLVGGNGDDWLEGGVGSDTIAGGVGDDTIIVDAQDNLANISGGAGFDTIVLEGDSSTSFNIQLNLTNGFESAIGGDGDDNISAQQYQTIPLWRTRLTTNGTWWVESLKGYTDLPIIQTYIISGGAGNDIIRGGVGNDILEGGVGNDTLYGDWGNDTYLFKRGDGRDTIFDALSINWSYAAQKMLTSSYALPFWINGGLNMGTDNVSEWIGNGRPMKSPYYFSTGDAFVYSNSSRNSDTIKMGGGILAADVVIEKANFINTYYFDLIVGLNEDRSYTSVTQLNDYIYIQNAFSSWTGVENIELDDGTKILISNWFQGAVGVNVNDKLTGNAYDNVLNGLAGADTMIGQAGNDIYVVDNVGDVVTENANQGTDTVQTSVTLNAELWVNVENLTLVGSSNINGLGNSTGNIIKGNAGNNVLNGAGGIDTLIGGFGDDTYIVDTLTDTITELENGGIDTVQSSITYSLSGQLNLENITLSGTNEIHATGNALNNLLTGNDAKNVLNGGAGIDTLRGGNGDDVYIVDSSFDLIQELEGEGLDKVESSVTYTLSEHVENLILTGSANINGTGNSLDNMITGNAGSNILNGILGNDTLVGGAGNDTYIVSEREYNGHEDYEAGIDLILDNDNTINNADTLEVGFENVLSQEAYNAPDGAYSLYLDIKRLLTNDGHDNLKLTARSVYITDSPYSTGEEFGGFLIQDQFKSSSKIEQIKFASGEVDTLDNYLGRVGYSFFGSDNNDVMKSDSAIGAREFYAGLGNDYLLGNSEIDRFSGNLGNDIFQSMSGGDYLYGYEDNDLLDGGSGVDRLYAGVGNDIVIGGNDADIITAGTGYDVLLFNKGDGADTVNASVGTDNTLSLGGNFAYSELSLSKSASDLILKMGSSDQITFKGWYNGTANYKSISNLQIVLDDSRINSAITVRNEKVEIFNFADVVAAFDAAGSTNNWQLSDTLLSEHIKSGSDNLAIGGDIAYRYGKFGNLTGMGLSATQTVLSNPGFGQTTQAFSTAIIGSSDAIKLS